jgi:hypothetical protein
MSCLLLQRVSGLVHLYVPLAVLLQPLEEALPVHALFLQKASQIRQNLPSTQQHCARVQLPVITAFITIDHNTVIPQQCREAGHL